MREHNKREKTHTLQQENTCVKNTIKEKKRKKMSEGDEENPTKTINYYVKLFKKK